MLRLLQLLLFVGSSIAKSICNEDYYGNCIEKECPRWFDGNHTCDIVYDEWKIQNMTCTDIICDKPHEPLCIEPGYHLNTTCDLVPNSYEWIIIYPFMYTIPLLGFVITSIYCAPRQRFSTKLTDLDKDIGTTCLTCWCPCITFGSLFQHTYNVPSILGCLIYFFCGSFKCCLGIFNREKLRQKYNIVDEPCNDFMVDCCIHCWAHPCALCQEKRELDYHRNDIESTARTSNNLIGHSEQPVQTIQTVRPGPPGQPVYLVMATSIPNQPIVINGTLPNVITDEQLNEPPIQVIDNKE